ncbi:glycogen synthase GlgA [Desulfitobacterium sp.]|uniref:glycogen synthase GlgA n=1 Tax=Desulfitobacterium sp. TaxID=49981 RepID=UPI002C030908|nr:glycogen synthase GlgA [Desulfitobacterium sp.]HVJ49012.1 glycogen synthase GlgA [Desulfitobacterium sp.]
MRILFVTPEADPFIKTGGLGEVGGSLPLALKKLGLDVRVMMPQYSQISEELKREIQPVAQFRVPLAWRQQYCGLGETKVKGIPYYFIDNEYYFKRSGIYGFYDQAEQYAFFCRSVLESLPYLGDFHPDIIHCNDWQTALIPMMLKLQSSDVTDAYPRARSFPIKTVFTIHNLQYQGVFAKEVLGDILGLGQEFFTAETLEFNGAVNFMKAALLYADHLTTVSPTYAQEIQTPYYGEKLEGLLQKRRASLTGILNGIDIEKYPVAEDELTDEKRKYKRDLQHLMNLPLRPEVPVLAIVSRLVNQKGMDLLAHVLEEILELDVQMVVLGTGEQHYETMFRDCEKKHPGKLVARILFDEPLARVIYAGSDLFLMPSRFEPCGIAQMIAMRYGSIPIVRETGGLKDTVLPLNEDTGKGNGFSFANYNAQELLFTVQRAVHFYKKRPGLWKRLKLNAQATNFSWDRSARQYLELYQILAQDEIKLEEQDGIFCVP